MHIKSDRCRQPSMACCIVLSYEVQISSLPRRDVPMLPFLSELPVVSRDELPFSSLLSFFFFSAALNSDIHCADVIHCAAPHKRLTCTLFLNRAACSILFPPLEMESVILKPARVDRGRSTRHFLVFFGTAHTVYSTSQKKVSDRRVFFLRYYAKHVQY